MFADKIQQVAIRLGRHDVLSEFATNIIRIIVIKCRQNLFDVVLACAVLGLAVLGAITMERLCPDPRKLDNLIYRGGIKGAYEDHLAR